jgi:hypothetical protein
VVRVQKSSHGYATVISKAVGRMMKQASSSRASRNPSQLVLSRAWEWSWRAPLLDVGWLECSPRLCSQTPKSSWPTRVDALALTLTLQLHLTLAVRRLLSFPANIPSLSSPRLPPAVFLARRISYTQALDLYFA